ncbi:MAG: putative baseplate assembly protein [Pseudomonadota bacterium]|nr:putative baseplate assembly protein [Pseudomonadota bacterium]
MIEAIGSGPPNPAKFDDPRWPAETRVALASLTTREDGDYAIMFVDLFAAVADVLTFYSERFVNEFYIRTVRDRDSLLRLVRLIGYRLNPGSAATTMLSFRLDQGSSVRIPEGLKVMSVPGQDELPQIFETTAQINADARLNALPLFGRPKPIPPFAHGRTLFPILARPSPLLTGDRIAIVGDDTLELQEVQGVEQRADGEYLSIADAVSIGGSGSVGFRVLRQLRFFGHDVPDSYPWYDADPNVAPAKRWVTRKSVTSFGPGLTRYPLESKIDDLKRGALLLFDLGSGTKPRYSFAMVRSTEDRPASVGPSSDSVTWVEISPVIPIAGDSVFTPTVGLPRINDRRATRIFELDPQSIVPRAYVYPELFSGGTALIRSDHLDRPEQLMQKQNIAIADGQFRQMATIGSIKQLPAGKDGIRHIEIGFSPPVGSPVAAPSLNGNIAPASHGETQPEEVLGHGDAAQLFQSFRLRKKGLTRIPTGMGIAPRSAITVRLNGELWEEATSFFGRRPTDRIYTLRDDDDGFTTISFGDGRTGARTPSGASNISARYRAGLGVAGRVRADQLTTLLERPPGLSAVSNPLAADGGKDPETIDDARRAAPVTVRTFGRAISLGDFEDIARRTGLVSRARATWAWLNAEQAIQLTVAGESGARLSPAAMKTLFEALGTARDPTRLLIIGNLWRVPIVVQAKLLREPAYSAEQVEAAARSALLDAVAFDVQPLGKALHLSEVITALQSATGVRGVDVDRFQIKGTESWTAPQLLKRGATSKPVQQHVRIFDARPRPESSSLDPLALAGIALDPNAIALPAEQAFFESPNDIALTVVEAL